MSIYCGPDCEPFFAPHGSLVHGLVGMLCVPGMTTIDRVADRNLLAIALTHAKCGNIRGFITSMSLITTVSPLTSRGVSTTDFPSE